MGEMITNLDVVALFSALDFTREFSPSWDCFRQNIGFLTENVMCIFEIIYGHLSWKKRDIYVSFAVLCFTKHTYTSNMHLAASVSVWPAVWSTVLVCLTDSFHTVCKYGIYGVQKLARGTALHRAYLSVCVCVCACYFSHTMAAYIAYCYGQSGLECSRATDDWEAEGVLVRRRKRRSL